MPWFKVDDSFHSHPKVWACSPGALGLWVVAGAWASANLKDGFVPDHAIPRLLPGAQELANELVTAGLWRRSKGGYQFHDWHDYNPTAEDVQADRKAARERMRKLRSKRRVDSESAGDEANGSREHSRTSSERSADVRNPDPTRPEGSKEPSSAPRRGKKGTRIPEDFAVDADMVAWAGRECPDADGRFETDQFRDYWTAKSGQAATKLDWGRTWKTWMRNAQKRAEETAARRGEHLTRHIDADDERCPDHPRQLAGACAICASERKSR